jgi:hypothetical protein
VSPTPASAFAATFGELPSRPVDGTATCLRATGAPGEVVRWTKTGAQFLQAGPGGFTPAGDVPANGEPQDCPAVAAQPGGASRIVVEAFGLADYKTRSVTVRVR